MSLTPSLTARVLASGPGWSVSDVICTAGPRDRPYEERHDTVSIAAVTAGTFQYRSGIGRAVLAPGGLLLGNAGACFECGHEHGAGDRCLAFGFTPALLEDVVAAVPGARHAAFAVPHLPPLSALLPLIAAAEAAREEGDAGELEELALRLAGAVAATLADTPRPAPPPSRRDERRISEALRRIETQAHEPLTLAELAREAGMSAYHFLRTFRRVAGMPPHQYVLHTRLYRAAVRLRTGDEPISAIAFDAGFGDLSTFNRRFRRVMGCSPSAYARAGQARVGGRGVRRLTPTAVPMPRRLRQGSDPVLRIEEGKCQARGHPRSAGSSKGATAEPRCLATQMVSMPGCRVRQNRTAGSVRYRGRSSPRE
jgi:AraC family transcriptional regulator